MAKHPWAGNLYKRWMVAWRKIIWEKTFYGGRGGRGSNLGGHYCYRLKQWLKLRSENNSRHLVTRSMISFNKTALRECDFQIVITIITVSSLAFLLLSFETNFHLVLFKHLYLLRCNRVIKIHLRIIRMKKGPTENIAYQTLVKKNTKHTSLSENIT